MNNIVTEMISQRIKAPIKPQLGLNVSVLFFTKIHINVSDVEQLAVRQLLQANAQARRVYLSITDQYVSAADSNPVKRAVITEFYESETSVAF